MTGFRSCYVSFPSQTAPRLNMAGQLRIPHAADDGEAFLGRLDPPTRSLVDLVVHPGATHAFDRNLPGKVVTDPFAHDGAGGGMSARRAG